MVNGSNNAIAVIPAKAGIQTSDNISTQWDNTLNTALSAARSYIQQAGFRPSPE
ncbi:MAG: hypothetical protein IPN81_07500 [Nitrosomonadales bacterium]|nr:hypothetical protein [Nitrosomonadales bacterium]